MKKQFIFKYITPIGRIDIYANKYSNIKNIPSDIVNSISKSIESIFIDWNQQEADIKLNTWMNKKVKKKYHTETSTGRKIICPIKSIPKFEIDETKNRHKAITLREAHKMAESKSRQSPE